MGKFFENKIKFLSGLNGGGRNPQEIVEAVASGNLFDLLNLGPVHQAGLPVISDQELEKQVEMMLVMTMMILMTSGGGGAPGHQPPSARPWPRQAPSGGPQVYWPLIGCK